MTVIRTFLISLLSITTTLAFSQARFITDGTVEYEKTINAYAIIKRQIELTASTSDVQQFDQFKKNQPQFKTLKSTLSFSKDKTLFEPTPSADNRYIDFITNNPFFEQNNTVYSDLSSGLVINQKQVFEQTFLVKDSIRPINWKITDETRDIAGYSCRRANGIMLDSIYVVAFYAETIPVPGGPESFTGLPGMILGVALPHENMTWFATKVNDRPVQALKAPEKGKDINNKELRATLESALKIRGKQWPLLMKAFLL